MPPAGPTTRVARADPLESRTLLAFAPLTEYEVEPFAGGSVSGTIMVPWNGATVRARAGEWVLRLDAPGGHGGLSATAARRLVAQRRPNVAVESLGGGLFQLRARATLGYDELHRSLRRLPGFRYVQPNLAYQLDALPVPDDAMFHHLWGLDNTGQTGGTPDADVDAPEAWAAGATGEGVVVAVLDSGVKYDHPDLAANMWHNPGETGADSLGRDKATNGVDDDGNGFRDDVFGADTVADDGDPMDEEGHGTHVAGTIAAVANNRTGVAGVAPRAEIMALRGSPVSTYAIKSFRYLIDMRRRGVNVRVVNCSWGFNGDFYRQDDFALRDLIEEAGRAGIMVVTSAGNEGLDTDVHPHFPSSFDAPNIVSVAATDNTDAKPVWSNFGRVTVDVGAPGNRVVSSVPTAGPLSSPTGVAFFSGTSMAAPHVSGLAALAFSARPRAGVEAVKRAILDGGDAQPGLADITTSGRRASAAGMLRVLREAGLGVTSSSPYDGEVLAEPPTEVTVSFDEPLDPASLQPSDLVVGGVASDSVELSADGYDVTFRFAQTPVTRQGPWEIRLDAGAVARAADGAAGPAAPLRSVFYYDVTRGTVASVTPEEGRWLDAVDGTAELDVRFSEPIDAASVQPSDLWMYRGGVFSVGEVLSAQVLSADTVRFVVGNFDKTGSVPLAMLDGAVSDAFGNPLRGFADVRGHAVTTAITPVFPDAVRPWGVPAYHRPDDLVGIVDGVQSVERYPVNAYAGHVLRATLTPKFPVDTLRAKLALVGPGGAVLAQVLAPRAGEPVVLESGELPEDGRYVLTVNGLDGTVGPYAMEVLVNAPLEGEHLGGPANDTREESQDLSGDFRQLTSGLAAHPGPAGSGPGSGTFAAVYGHADGTGLLPAEVEPNDTRFTANSAAANFTPVPPQDVPHLIALRGALDVRGDVDWYNLGNGGGGHVLATVSGAASSRGTLADPLLRIYRQNVVGQIELIATDDNSGPGNDALLELTLNSPTAYYAAVSSPAGVGTYELSLYRFPGGTPPQTGGTVRQEVEPNNSAAAATDASSSWAAARYQSSTSGRFTSGGVLDRSDYFSYYFKAGDLVTVETGRVMTSAVLTVRDAQGNVLGRTDTVTPGGEAEYRLDALGVRTTGLYYVSLGSTGSSFPYALKVTLSSDTEPPRPAPRYDYYRLPLAAGQRVTAALKRAKDASAAPALRLEDAAGNVLASGAAVTAAGRNFDAAVQGVAAPAAGDYFVRVESDLPLDYHLVLLRDAVIDSGTNETEAAAQDVTGAARVVGNVFRDADFVETDWYKFDVPAGTLVRLDTKTADMARYRVSWITALDPLVELYDPAGNLLATDDNSAPDGVNAAVTFAAAAGGTYRAKVTVVRGGGIYTLDVATSPLNAAAVNARRVFYNRSKFDGNDPAATAADDEAIAPDKQALLPGQAATIANYTSYSRGINGVMIDVAGLPAGATLSPADFVFRIGRGGDPSAWRPPPAPASVTVRPGAGLGGSDRVTLVWPDGAIRNTWLQVTLKATANTGLSSPDVFYFGNVAGESDRSLPTAVVNGLDLYGTTISLYQGPAGLDVRYDHNRDGRVTTLDLLVVRVNRGKSIDLFTAPPAS